MTRNSAVSISGEQVARCCRVRPGYHMHETWMKIRDHTAKQERAYPLAELMRCHQALGREREVRVQLAIKDIKNTRLEHGVETMLWLRELQPRSIQSCLRKHSPG